MYITLFSLDKFVFMSHHIFYFCIYNTVLLKIGPASPSLQIYMHVSNKPNLHVFYMQIPVPHFTPRQ